MKKTLTILIALGLISPPLFAQLHSGPQPTQGVDAGSGSASGSSSSSGASSASGTSESGSGAEVSLSPIARLKPVTQDGVSYLCGGVGEEEEAYMKQEAKAYDMMLTFATREGAYLANVDVDIRNAKGDSVLQMACDSPILLVDLPKGGNYRVRAETAGYSLNKTVKVGTGKGRGQNLTAAVLSWPQQVTEGGPGSAVSTGSSGNGSRGSAGSGKR